MIKNFFFTIITAIFLSFSLAYALDNKTPNYYEQGAALASHLKKQDIGKDQNFTLEYVYKGLKNSLDKRPSKNIPKNEKSSTSFAIGYITGQNNLKTGEIFTFKSEKIKYDPTAVLKGIVDHYRNHNPQYKIIPKNNLINPSKSKSIELSDSEYCYNLGYSIFEIPKNYLDSNFIDEDAFIDGLTAGLNNKKLNLSSNELNETSYIMGCLLYEPEFFNFKNISDKNNFLKGFYDESQTNDL